VYARGYNDYGQLGTNVSDVGSISSPIRVAGISHAVLVSAPSTGQHSLAMTVDGGTNRYWAWGRNDKGQVGNGTNSANATDPDHPYQYTPAQLQFCTRCQRCVQLGTNGTLYAQCTGTLKLYFNDDQSAFGDNNGSYNVMFNGSNVTVMAASSAGVAVGTVTNGGVYTYSATGTCYHCNIGPDFCPSDANGTNPNTTNLWNCSDLSVVNRTNTVCPAAPCFSLVGRIQ
jgi:hypothetical protein